MATVDNSVPETGKGSGAIKDPHDIDLIGDLRQIVFEEVIAMAEYAYNKGMKVPEETVALIQDCKGGLTDCNFQALSNAHNSLATVVAPAQPSSIAYLRDQTDKLQRKRSFFKRWLSFRFLGPISVIRQMVAVSILSLCVFIWFSMFENADPECATGTCLSLFFGHDLTHAVYLLSAAAIGASFLSLYNAYDYVGTGTFDPNYNVSYWVRFFLGLTSGYILAALIFDNTGNQDYSPQLIAMLGGFSASAVYRILERVVEALGSIVDGGTKTKIESYQADFQARLDKQDLERKAAFVEQALKVKSEIADTTDNAAIRSKIDDLINQTLQKT